MKTSEITKQPRTRRDLIQVYFDKTLYSHIKMIAARESAETPTTIKDVAERAIIAGLKALNLPEFQKQDRVA